MDESQRVPFPWNSGELLYLKYCFANKALASTSIHYLDPPFRKNWGLIAHCWPCPEWVDSHTQHTCFVVWNPGGLSGELGKDLARFDWQKFPSVCTSSRSCHGLWGLTQTIQDSRIRTMSS